jgi:hypothetical protein
METTRGISSPRRILTTVVFLTYRGWQGSAATWALRVSAAEQ